MSDQRRIGDDMVSPIGLGCMNVSQSYGPALNEGEAVRLISQAADEGYTFFDTATTYGLGMNEQLVGKALGARRDEVFIASKCVLGFKEGGRRTMDARPESIKAACDASLQRLGTDRIDLYYMHRPDARVPIEDSVGALSECVEAGKIRYVGLSEMGARLLRRAHAVHPIAAMQSEYSLWVRNPEIAVLEACKEIGAALVAFSPVGRGFLADPPVDPAQFHEVDMRPRISKRFDPDTYAANLPLLDAAREVAARVGCSVAQLALAWTLAKGEHVLSIPGTRNPAHMAENFAAADVELDADTVAELDVAFSPEKAVGGRYSDMAQSTVDTERFAFEEVG